jgi:hypothetical protein
MTILGPTISAEDLSLAGTASDLAVALQGLTWGEAKAKLSAVIALSAGNEALQRGAIASYTMNGRSVTANLSQLKQALDVVRAGLAYVGRTGGITALPVEFGA